MKQAVILHGTKGSPEGNWFPWMQSTLSLNWDVTVPNLPTPDDQNLESWIAAYQAQAPQDAHLIIGHSLGATFILKLMDRGLIDPAHVILISIVIDNINIAEYDELNKSFIENDIDYKNMKQRATQFTIIHGDDDPYVPLDQPQHVAKELGVTLHLIEKGGHLNSESGYTEFPDLLKYIHD